MHYQDYVYDSYMPCVSFLSSIAGEGRPKMLIGSPVFCVNCTAEVEEANSLLCEDCGNPTVCPNCGSVVERDEIVYFEDERYCEYCTHTCDSCYTATPYRTTVVVLKDGNEAEYCSDCVERHAHLCSKCSRLFAFPLTTVDDEYYCPECLPKGGESDEAVIDS
jgi:DNA-directed RNA polymerase subunit RPC12/RpoP